MAQAARKVTAKDANEKLAHRRLTALKLAERPAHSSFTLCTQPSSGWEVSGAELCEVVHTSW